MRLTAIKLAGFKSFVDPTNIPIVGNMVGVVGPNGCGKSNVIDAVRWVLGESQAKQLRGASMADVIFNGSSTRKAVSRASVELTFDNSDASAPGQWAQYAEISVKRILTRNGESSYHINNTHVRRRDLVDIFLGTGLGTKTSYAIIEQGMISRIIEAKPEELRGFLEEAAGISKYKERRRETESRLKDTRDNLLRLDDIRRELDEQIGLLREQAITAQHYLTLQDQLKRAQQLLWLVKKRDALANQQRHAEQISLAEQQLAAQEDSLRGLVYQLESQRGDVLQANHTLNDAQGVYYAAVAEVSRLEQSARHLQETRARLEAQSALLSKQHASFDQQHQALTQQYADTAEAYAESAIIIEAAEYEGQEINDSLPEITDIVASTTQRVHTSQQALITAEQAHQLASAHGQHAEKTVQQLQTRQARLHQELGGLTAVDSTAIAEMSAMLDEFNESLAILTEQLADNQQTLADLIAQRLPLQQHVEQLNRQHHQTAGELAGLNKIQQSLSRNNAVDAWLQQHDLHHAPRIWQTLHIENGWETALEAVLNHRMQAVAADLATMQAVADSRVILFDNVTPPLAVATVGAFGLPRLLDKITLKSPLHGALHDWLAQVYITDDISTARAMQHDLPLGAQIVSPAGHILTRHSLQFYAEQDAAQGILARQNEIERLTQAHASITSELAINTALADELQATINDCQHTQTQLRTQHTQTQQQLHQSQLNLSRRQQEAERVDYRRAQITAEQAEIDTQIQQEGRAITEAQVQFTLHHEQITLLQAQLDDARRARQDADGLLQQQRELQRQAERKLQTLKFTAQTQHQKIHDLARAIELNQSQQATLLEQHESISIELLALDTAEQSAALQVAIAHRVDAEQQLAALRDQLEQRNALLRQQEETRMQLEHSLAPLRATLENLRLKHQEAALLLQQSDAQLVALQADETALALVLNSGFRTAGLNQEINKLTAEIEALGAVNLAAMQALESAEERVNYLQAQADDLNLAMNTLTEVMTTIDGETRDLLKSTFDIVNRSMSELFTTLFGGGRAELILSGDDLLDAGVQVFAQPPGKKNSSIHLLSGGEKALTALSLVFALFKLTPAPFCLLDEVDAPLDDTNTERYARLVKQMSAQVQFLFITHNRITMEAAEQLIGVTMQESGVSRTVSVDLTEAVSLAE
ncbi:MAG: chromosome segregation protein SMC [Sulfuriferula sp.]|nr:chromosome segregation protein SMC [Sulfuriferula sp.]